MADLKAFCAALNIDPAAITTGRYRGTGERSDRKGWRVASVPHRSDWHGRVIITESGPTDEAALAALTSRLHGMVRYAAKDARRRATELRERAESLREDALECEATATAVDAEAAKLEKVCDG